MAGITEWPFRLLCQRQGADELVSEMISAMGLLQAPRDSVSFACLLAAHPEEKGLIAQIFGREPDLMARAAKILSAMDKYAGIDINFGCPAQKVTSSGSGSALMKDLKLSGRILRAVRHATGKRLSVKMRIGWDAGSVNAVEFARICEDEGVEQICVHGRTREQQYAGKADWDMIARVREAVSVPLIANGDVFSAGDALAILKHTGAEGIAVGRGALGNPWIFRQIKAALAGEHAAAPTPDEVRETALTHLEYMVSFKGGYWALIEMRKHFGWYLKGSKGAAATRARVNSCLDLKELTALLMTHFAAQSD
jgi:tRNA-dihydrouridine synthase B